MKAWLDQSARRWLERSTRDWVFRRKLPPEFGSIKIFVSPSAGLKYLLKPMSAVDRALLSVAGEFVRPGDVVWDVGANIGLFSFAAAAKSGPKGNVIAVEPDPWLVQLLRRSASQLPHRCAGLTVVPAAVAQHLRLGEFQISPRSRARSALLGFGYDIADHACETQSVIVVTLDWLAQFLPPPDLIKIDVEGAELDVLEGADRLLETKRPILVCEVCRESQENVTKLLHDRDYLLYDCDDPLPGRTQKDAAPWSTLAVPKGWSEYA